MTTTDGRTVVLKDDGSRAYIAANVPAGNKWTMSVDIDPVDDTKRFHIALKADSGTSLYGRPIYLYLRKAGRQTEVFIAWDNYPEDTANVTWRVPDPPAEDANWSFSTNSQGTFYPYSDIELVKDLTTVSRFVARVSPYGESPVTAVPSPRGGCRTGELRHEREERTCLDGPIQIEPHSDDVVNSLSA